MQKKSETTKNKGRQSTGSRFFWAIASVLISLLIWVYYGSNFGTEMTKTLYGVELTYSGQDAMRDSLNLVIADVETTSVNVTLTGSRRDISKLTSSDLKAVVNLSSVTSAGYRTMGYTISYPSSVNSSGITEKKEPQTVGLQISRLTNRVVDVTGRFEGSLQEGYALDSSGMTFEPASITLTGPQEELDQIHHADVVVSRDDVNASFTATANYTLVNADGEPVVYDDVTTDADTVAVTVPINVTKAVKLDVALIEGGGATADNVVKKIEPETITIAGDSAAMDGINTIYIATIDISDYESFPSTEYPIILPNDTDNLSAATTATVELTFTGVETAWYTVTNLEYTNLTEGYTADVMDATLVVNIRAPEGVLEDIEANNIRAVADLTGITATSRAPVTIYVDGFADAGAVGDYALYVRVRPEEAGEPEADG